MLLGRRIRSLREMKGWTQQELGEAADINYKFLGAIERGQQNPSFDILVKVASALEVELPVLFQFGYDAVDRKEMEKRLNGILKSLPDATLNQVLLILDTLFPVRDEQ